MTSLWCEQAGSERTSCPRHHGLLRVVKLIRVIRIRCLKRHYCSQQGLYTWHGHLLFSHDELQSRVYERQHYALILPIIRTCYRWPTVYVHMFIFVSQGLHYDYFEIKKPMDLSGDESPDFQKALSVHPVSSPEQMYRLHRYFTERELQKTYEEIKKLQVDVVLRFFLLCLSVAIFFVRSSSLTLSVLFLHM